ncbi:MAG: SMEK domain-containing protein [Chlorobiota bacterium]
MLGSGHMIGKIVDDLALLMKQVELRNGIKQYDLTLLCENFFKDVLNVVYDLNLENLNHERTNSPGIDLGCEKNKIAYQITSTKTTQKVNKTLKALTDEQKQEYKRVVVFIIGSKQGSYNAVKEKVSSPLDFKSDNDIMDIKDLLKDIVVLSPSQLEGLFSLFKSQFRRVSIELEVVDEEGNYASSLANIEESIPNKKPITANSYLEYLDLDEDDSKEEFKNLMELYLKLSMLPRITREYLLIIQKRGTEYSEGIKVLPKTLEHVLRLNKTELVLELNLLLEKNIIEIETLDLGNYDCMAEYIIIPNDTLLGLLKWANNDNINLRKLINTMDWSVLD